MALIVGRDALGVSEQEWLSSTRLAAVATLAEPVLAGPRPKVVVVAPHPDDEVLGSGGLLQWLSAAGADIEILSVSDGEAAFPHWSLPRRARLARQRRLELRVAVDRLGLESVTFTRLGLPDGAVAGGGDTLAEVLNRLLPTTDLCLAPWPRDGHPDHDAAGRVALDVTQARGVTVLFYPVWMWHWADPHGDDLPWASFRRWTLTPVERARKRWASAAFESQITAVGPHPQDGAIIPPPVLRRFWRPFEIFVEVDGCR